MATVPATLAALVALEAQITGVVPYAYPPDTLERANLPCCINLAGLARHSRAADTYIVEVREYAVLVPVVGLADLRSQARFERATGYLDSFIRLFQGQVKLGGLDATIQQVVLVSDTGIAIFMYESDVQRYVGFEFTLSVTSKQALAVVV